MKKALLILFGSLLLCAALQAQTATPTPTFTSTPTFTPTLTRTPSPAAANAVVPLIVSAGNTASSSLELNETQSYSITIWAPATIDTSATVQINYLHASNTGWTSYQQTPGTDLTIVAGKAITVTAVQAAALRILGGASAGAERTFYVTATRLTK